MQPSTCLLVALLFGIASAIPISHCDPEYECSFTYSDISGISWEFDLQPLCNSKEDYSIVDAQNHTYYFNLCGITHVENRCLPEWHTNEFQYGSAVQMFGDAPKCNTTHPACSDPEIDQLACCTKPCQVLGVGIPVYQPLNPHNPLFGGLSITHMGVPPSSADPYPCPQVAGTGIPEQRRIEYRILCDLDATNLVTLNVTENPDRPCHYVMYLKSEKACGCAPDCSGQNCGHDGCGGTCGGLNGDCPLDYKCNSQQVCCRPSCDYLGRQCGNDGCEGSCGTCPAGQICNRDGMCATIEQPSPTPSPRPNSSPDATHTIVKTSKSDIAGAFFGGIIGTVVVAGGAFFVYKRRQSGLAYSS